MVWNKTPKEKVATIKEYLETCRWTQKDIATMVGVSIDVVYEQLRLYDKEFRYQRKCSLDSISKLNKNHMVGRTGSKHQNYRVTTNHSGYKLVDKPADWTGFCPRENKIFEHQYNWAKLYNQTEVPKGLEIHHIDLNKFNNDPSNLQLLTKNEHMQLHMEIRNSQSATTIPSGSRV